MSRFALDTFYAPPESISGRRATIEGGEFSHLTHVMRKQVGDAILIVDGAGMSYEGVIDAIDRTGARCSITARHERLREPDIDLAVAVGILKHPASMDFMVEKLTELGVTSIVPLQTERTIPRQVRTDRWEKIALAAMKQCGRCLLPAIADLTPLDNFLEHTSHEVRLIPHEQVERPLLSAAVPPGARRITVCIGPEGGFTETEIRRATAAGFQPVSLGERRLRTETAALAAATIILPFARQ